MWANNEVGSLQPLDEVVAIAREHRIPVHTDAVQALGQVPVDFADSGVDALTFTGHKVGGPYGVGALVVRRDLPVSALVHGGGQERDIRSGTLDVPAIAGLAAAVEASVKAQHDHAVRIAELRDDLVRRVVEVVPDAHLHGAPAGPGRLPGNAHIGFPGCEGDSLLMLLDARGIECSTGSACSAGVPQPSHVLLAMGCDDAPGPPLAPLLARPHHDPRRHRRPRRGHRAGRRAGAGGPGALRVPSMKVVAAMSGGVDSAVAAARAVEAGHDVTGVHLALSRNPASYRSGARGCCTIEDSNDARRAADVIGIPFYVWDLSDRFHEDVVEDFMDEYAAGRTPNPCLRCNEKIKFAAVLDRALALGFDAVATGHYAQLRTGADGLIEMHRAERPRQGPVLRPRRARPVPAAPLAVPARRHRQAGRASRGRGARAARRRQARLARHLLRRRRRQRRLAAREARRPCPQPRRRHRRRHGRGRRSAATRAPTASRSASVAACASAPPPPTASRASCSTSSRSAGPSRSVRARTSRSTTSRASGRAGAAPSPSGSTAPCSCARTAPSTARRSSSTATGSPSTCSTRPRASRPARPP